MATMPASGDRRRHPRCPVKGRAVAFSGGCTCAVQDVSLTGLALNCAVFDPEQRVAAVVDLFLADSALYLPRMPIRLVAEVCLAPPCMFSSLRVRRVGLQFGPLADEQRHGLDQFIIACRTPSP
jgi:hypothetical protein